MAAEQRSQATEALKAALVRQFGAASRAFVTAEVDGRLQGRSRIGRDDLDAIEQGVLAAMRTQRAETGTFSAAERFVAASAPTAATYPPPSARAAVAQPHTPAKPPSVKRSTSAPSAAATVGLGEGFSSSSTARPLATAAKKQLLAAPTSSKLTLTSSASDGILPAARTSSGADRLVPLKPRMRPFDHFDVLAEFETACSAQEEKERQLERKRRQETFKAGLDGQAIERCAARERAAEERTRERKQVLEAQEDFAREQEEERQRLAAQREANQRSAQEAQEAWERRRVRREEERAREQALVRRTVEKETQRLAKADEARERVREEKGREFLENIHAAQVAREQRKREQEEFERGLDEKARKAAEEREGKRAAELVARQERLDHIMNTMGAPLAKRREEEERAREERDAKHLAERDAKDKEAALREQEWRDGMQRNVSETNLRMAEERANTLTPRRIVRREQAEIWKRDPGESEEAKRHALSRVLRQEMDEHCLNIMRKNAAVHKSEFGYTAERRHQELAYNKDRLQRLEVCGYRPDVVVPWLDVGRATRPKLKKRSLKP